MTSALSPSAARGTMRLRLHLFAALAWMLAVLTARAQPPITDQEAARKLRLPVETVEQLKGRFRLSNEELVQLPPAVLARRLRKLEERDDPGARLRYFRAQEETDLKAPPPDARRKALDEVATLRSRLPGRSRIAGLPSGSQVDPRRLAFRTAGLSRSGWQSLGPSFLGGRTRALLIDPRDPAIMLAAAAAGGVWRSVDGGKSWFPTDDYMANLAVCTLARDPSNPDIVYAGTGEGFNNADRVRGGGIFVSKDGGSKWKPLAAPADFHHVNRLAVSADGRTLLAVVLAEDANGDVQPAKCGIYYSTDGGREWKKATVEATTPGPKGDLFADVKFHPTDKDRAIAGGLRIWDNADRAGRVYYSPDGGRTWKEATVKPDAPNWTGGRVEVTYAVGEPKTVYASVQVLPRAKGQPPSSELWRSTDGGETYQRCAAGDGTGEPAYWLGHRKPPIDLGWYANTVWAAGQDLVVVGGLDLWLSNDGGKTLRRISGWTKWQWNQVETSPHADQHVVVAHPKFDGRQNKTVYFGNDGGVFVAQDVLATREDSGWQALNLNYQTMQFYGAAGHAGDGVIVVGAQDNGTYRVKVPKAARDPLLDPQGKTRLAPPVWDHVAGGDGGFCAIDPHDTTRLYGEYPSLSIFRSVAQKVAATGKEEFLEDSVVGQYFDFEDRKWKWKSAPFLLEDAKEQQALFIAPFVIDPNDAKSNRLLAGGARLWRTNNVKEAVTNDTGPKWEVIRDAAPVVSAGKTYPNPISAVAVAKGNADVIWVGQRYGQVHRTLTGTAAADTVRKSW